MFAIGQNVVIKTEENPIDQIQIKKKNRYIFRIKVDWIWNLVCTVLVIYQEANVWYFFYSISYSDVYWPVQLTIDCISTMARGGIYGEI